MVIIKENYHYYCEWSQLCELTKSKSLKAIKMRILIAQFFFQNACEKLILLHHLLLPHFLNSQFNKSKN